MLDRFESPGSREVSALQKPRVVSDEKVLLGLVEDVSKAHRRFLCHPEQWGVLVCRSVVLWFNRTGAFGVASAAFWFSRLMGLVGRLSFRVMLQAFVFMLICVPNLHLLSGGKDKSLHFWMMLALMCIQGTPFSSHKWRGGFQIDWVGYWIDYTRFHIGISEKHCQWIIVTITSLSDNGGLVDVRRFHELHGCSGLRSSCGYVRSWLRDVPGLLW